jgi:hypothetical protein
MPLVSEMHDFYKITDTWLFHEPVMEHGVFLFQLVMRDCPDQSFKRDASEGFFWTLVTILSLGSPECVQTMLHGWND